MHEDWCREAPILCLLVFIGRLHEDLQPMDEQIGEK